MSISKQELEALISQQKTIGNYIFNKERQCFIADVPVELYLAKVAEDKYQTESYYFDDYKVAIEPEHALFFYGNEMDVKKQAIEAFNQEEFMGYKIIYKNISCEFV